MPTKKEILSKILFVLSNCGFAENVLTINKHHDKGHKACLFNIDTVTFNFPNEQGLVTCQIACNDEFYWCTYATIYNDYNDYNDEIDNAFATLLKQIDFGNNYIFKKFNGSTFPDNYYMLTSDTVEQLTNKLKNIFDNAKIEYDKLSNILNEIC